ncbi:hypothetical protein ACQ4M3_07295 [Leptolyngbya sp. AN03gr2]|uniref:hypothetical protein n=1 Tax=unclassified Leptolyngbya TaxID=2650499 RepID=UPI003D31E962
MLYFEPHHPIFFMDGLGCDSLFYWLNLLANPESRNISLEEFLRRTAWLSSMTQAEFSYLAWMREVFGLPVLAKHGGRYLQMTKGGSSVHDRYLILSDTRRPRKIWLYSWATPPLSPMSEFIPYDINKLYSPLHPLWNPAATWDLNYRPENFVGKPDPYLEWEYENPELVFSENREPCSEYRNHRHYVCPLPLNHPVIEAQNEAIKQIKQDKLEPLSDPFIALLDEQCQYFYQAGGSRNGHGLENAHFVAHEQCSKVEDKQSDLSQIQTEIIQPMVNGMGIGEYYMIGGTIPQVRKERRDCSAKAKVLLGEQAQSDLMQSSGYGLGQLMLDGGGIPQRASNKRFCSNVSKQEGAIWAIEDEVASGYGLGVDMLQGGAIPAVATGKGKGRCAIKHKNIICNQCADTVALEQQETISLPSNTSVDPQALSASINTLAIEELQDATDLALASPSEEDLLHWSIATAPLEYRKVKVPECRNRVPLLYNAEDETMAIPLPPYSYVLINYNFDEKRRVEDAEFSISEKQKERKTPKRPDVYRINLYGLYQSGVGRSELVQSLAEYMKEQPWRSACSICPFSQICGDKSEIIPKYQLLPHECGYAMLVELNANIANEKQTIFAGRERISCMMEAIGNTAALENLQARQKALPWAIYRYQRITGNKIYRNNKILHRGTWAEMVAKFPQVCHQMNAEIKESHGIKRGWIEYQEWTEVAVRKGKPVIDKKGREKQINCTSQDLLVVAPLLAIEKRKEGFAREWANLHQTQLTLISSEKHEL